MQALDILLLGVLFGQGESRFNLRHIRILRSLEHVAGAEELMDQLGARSCIGLKVRTLQPVQVVRMSKLTIRLVQSRKLQLSAGKYPAPVWLVVATLHQDLLFLKAIQKIRERIKAKLLYLLLQLPIAELGLGSRRSKVVAGWHSIVVEVVDNHRILVGGLLNVGAVFPPLPLGEMTVAEAEVVQLHLLEVLLRVLLRVVGGGELRVVVAVEVALVAEVVVTHDLLELGSGVGEVRLRVEALCQNCDVVVVLGCLHLTVNGADVHFLLVDHDHHLPLAFVLADTTELGASESVFTHVVVRPLWLLANKQRVRRALADSVHDLGLLLQELGNIHVLFDLRLQSDERGSALVLVLRAFKESLLVKRGAKVALPLTRIQLLPQDVVDQSILALVLVDLGCRYGMSAD